MDTIVKIVNYTTDYINAVPAESWYALGSFIGASALGVAVVAWINRHHLKQTGEKLGRVFVALNVSFWSAIMTVVTFILTTGPHFAAFFPFFGDHWMQIVGIMTLIYNVGKPSLDFWKKQKAEDISNVNLPNLAPIAASVTSTTTVSGTPGSNSSMGTQVAGVDVSPPPANLFS
jgi:uncharacterized membrane protein YbhN (UPF0104 family)